jgi:hypothetical protein
LSCRNKKPAGVSQDSIDQIAQGDESLPNLIELGVPLPLEHDFNDEVFQAIGLLMATAAHTDFVMSHHMLRLIAERKRRIPYHAAPLISGTDFKVKLGFYRVFVSLYFDDTDTRYLFNKILDRLESAYQRRNEIAHGSLRPRRNKTELSVQGWRIKPKLGGYPPPQVVTLNQIREWTLQLFIWTEQLTGLLDQLGFPRDADRRKARTTASRKRPVPPRSGQPSAKRLC